MNMPKTPKPEEDVINVASPPGFDAQAIPIYEVCDSQIKVPKERLEPAALKFACSISNCSRTQVFGRIADMNGRTHSGRFASGRLLGIAAVAEKQTEHDHKRNDDLC